MKERFPGELETLRADNARLRRLLELSEEQARGAEESSRPVDRVRWGVAGLWQ